MAKYFKCLKDEVGNNVINVAVKQSGIGTDEGSDILLELDIDDGIKNFKRKWVVQCKFHQSTISPQRINQINIPTLIHSHNASGYLLICKTRPTSGLTKLFDKLNDECTHGYKYEYWNEAIY